MEPTSATKYVGWAAMLQRNRATTSDNLRRALQNSTHPQDIAELRALDERVESYKAKAKAKPAPALSADLHPLLRLLVDRMPARPYFADDLSHGIRIRSRSEAIRHKEIQINAPWLRQCLVLDLDHDRKLDSRLPTPNVVVTNHATGHRHALIIWQTPVIVGPAASQRAQKYYTDLAVAVGQCWDADPCYTGTLAHSPLHKRWHTEILHPEPYELSAFRCALDIQRDMPANHPRFKVDGWADAYGALGRNCATWEACRWPSYAMGPSASVEAVLELVEAYNALHNTPSLGFRECLAIAKSISRYVLSGKRKGHSMLTDDWKAYVARTHTSEIQARRGKLGGVASGQARRQSREQERAQARLMRAQGSKYATISQVLGFPESTIRLWCKN